MQIKPTMPCCLTTLAAAVRAGETMLERWTLHFSPRGGQAADGAPVRLDTPAVYKRMVIALRSLYSYVRVLPAYRLHRACKVGELSAAGSAAGHQMSSASKTRFLRRQLEGTCARAVDDL